MTVYFQVTHPQFPKPLTTGWLNVVGAPTSTHALASVKTDLVKKYSKLKNITVKVSLKKIQP